MNAKKFSEALGEVDQSYLEEAVSYHRADRPFRRTRRLPAALTAAMLALLLIGCVAAAAGVFGTRLTGLFTSRTESGYDLSVAIERIPTQDLRYDTAAVRDLSAPSELVSGPLADRFPISRGGLPVHRGGPVRSGGVGAGGTADNPERTRNRSWPDLAGQP